MKEISDATSKSKWFKDRTWSRSGNTTGGGDDDDLSSAAAPTTMASRILFPETTEDVSRILSSLHRDYNEDDNDKVAVAVVAGGHSSSNTGTRAAGSNCSIVLDLSCMDNITVDTNEMEITAEAGVLTDRLAEAVSNAGGALPIGTGASVGVAGFVVNGGISGYFGKRLGMLGQRVSALTMVTADGTVKKLSSSSTGQDGELFRLALGAGSALGVVTSFTFRMEDESGIKTGGQFIVSCSNSPEKAKPFVRDVLTFLSETVLLDKAVSMELVLTADGTIILTFVFYDSFQGNASTYVEPVRDAAKKHDLAVVLDEVTKWKSWFEVASSLYPVISELKGDPLIRLDHCMGTRNKPSESVLDFVVDTWMNLPFDEAPMSLMEIRTIGGVTTELMALPSGNTKCQFFCNMIVLYDGKGKSEKQREEVSKRARDIVSHAQKQEFVEVEFSGTHSQPDDDNHGDGGDGGMYKVLGESVFGNKENYESLLSTKRIIDPNNIFRFHPFANIM